MIEKFKRILGGPPNEVVYYEDKRYVVTSSCEAKACPVKAFVFIDTKEFEDGGYEEVRVEEVDGGFIKTVCTRKKVDGEWTYKDDKSVTTEDPLKDNSSEGIADRLEKVLKNLQGDYAIGHNRYSY